MQRIATQLLRILQYNKACDACGKLRYYLIFVHRPGTTYGSGLGIAPLAVQIFQLFGYSVLLAKDLIHMCCCLMAIV